VNGYGTCPPTSANLQIARKYSTNSDTVRRWRAKFESGDVDAVGSIASGRGRKPEIDQTTIDEIVSDTLHSVPDDGPTAWSRARSDFVTVLANTLSRVSGGRKLKPWRVETFKLSRDPNFERKLVDVVGLVLHLTRKQHTADDVLAFFRWIDLHVPKHLDVHVVLDNRSAHSAPPVTAWLEHPKPARWHLAFTPTRHRGGARRRPPRRSGDRRRSERGGVL